MNIVDFIFKAHCKIYLSQTIDQVRKEKIRILRSTCEN